MQWTPVMKNFADEWKALEERKEEEDPETLVILKELPIIKWIEAFEDHLHRCVGIRCIPLVYVNRSNVAPPMPITAQAPNQCYTLINGSVEGDLIVRASHTHGLFPEDNKEVYFKLEEATGSTIYAGTIKPHQRTKNGRAAFMALKSQYAGKDKWEATLKKEDTMLRTR